MANEQTDTAPEATTPEEKQSPQTAEQPEDSDAGAGAPETPETPEDSEAPTAWDAVDEEPVDPLEKLQLENAALRDRLLRALAEVENTRRRAERNIIETRAYAVTGFARDMLNVVDNLRRALDNIPGEFALENHPLKPFIDGVELTERDLLQTLERHGVRKIDPLGERFDPHLHQAVFEMPDAKIPAGHVAVVVQPGFSIGDRVLRPAMVGVSKGGAAAAPEVVRAADPQTPPDGAGG
ncbi:MAG: nucleotide exchange factor GrpE [Methylobacteriaceae bacterium]|nr:nucleotide exchange factor GrpE [Methylobacteriaceae bacterium]